MVPQGGAEGGEPVVGFEGEGESPGGGRQRGRPAEPHAPGEAGVATGDRPSGDAPTPGGRGGAEAKCRGSAAALRRCDSPAVLAMDDGKEAEPKGGHAGRPCRRVLAR